MDSTVIQQKVSWPTIVLFFIALSGNIGSFFLPSYLGLLISSCCSYAHFTIVHDAIHGAVAKNRWINDTLGLLSQFWLGPTSNWWGLKYLHLRHHLKTNHPKEDPDIWNSTDGPGGFLLTPLRWATIDLHYWIFYREIIQVAPIRIFLYHLLAFLLIFASLQFGFGKLLLWKWILPSRIAIFFLSLFFDFLPHYPHKVTRAEDRYQTTAYLSIATYLRPFLSALILHQNYHIAHHLYPHVPFYRYGHVWEEKKQELIKIPVPIRRLFPSLGEERL